ncbi:MAG: hypothetical protein IJK52_08570 [Oscillospiraceae bacterium]|nr:hypothetical protein [Oscillospiraceae bacterium]
MARMDDRIVESYSGLLGALNRINKETPEIYEMYQQARREVEAEQAKLKEAREELRRLSKTLQRKISEADALKTAYQAKLDEWSAFQEETRKQSEMWREKIQEAEDLREKMMNAEPLLNYRLDELARAFNYDTNETVASMFQKYRDIGPVIVRRPNWSADAGFLVQGVRGNQVKGIAFKDGKPYPAGPTPRASSLCKIFHGPSQRDIFRYALQEQANGTHEKRTEKAQ